MGGSDFRGASLAAVKSSAFLQESVAGCVVDDAVLYHVSSILRQVGGNGELTTPPPPSKDVFAALTIHVVARSVMEVRMKEILEFRAASGVRVVEVFVGGRGS